MAQFEAIRVTCETVTEMLKTVHALSPISLPNPPSFSVFVASDFKKNPPDGVSLFLYRVYVNANQRSARTTNSLGKNLRPPLPLELHFFLTAWAKSASTQHTLLGWMMRTMEDFPLLTASFLNEKGGGSVFRAEETVELIPGQLTNEEMMRIWEDLQVPYQLSVPYVARVIRLDSTIELGADGPPVLERNLTFSTLGGGGS